MIAASAARPQSDFQFVRPWHPTVIFAGRCVDGRLSLEEYCDILLNLADGKIAGAVEICWTILESGGDGWGPIPSTKYRHPRPLQPPLTAPVKNGWRVRDQWREKIVSRENIRSKRAGLAFSSRSEAPKGGYISDSIPIPTLPTYPVVRARFLIRRGHLISFGSGSGC